MIAKAAYRHCRIRVAGKAHQHLLDEALQNQILLLRELVEGRGQDSVATTQHRSALGFACRGEVQRKRAAVKDCGPAFGKPGRDKAVHDPYRTWVAELQYLAEPID